MILEICWGKTTYNYKMRLGYGSIIPWLIFRTNVLFWLLFQFECVCNTFRMVNVALSCMKEVICFEWFPKGFDGRRDGKNFKVHAIFIGGNVEKSLVISLHDPLQCKCSKNTRSQSSEQ